MGLENSEILARKYTFKHYKYSRNAKLHRCNDTKRHKGEIFEDLYKISLKEFCEALQIKLLQCFTGSRFWKIYWKKFQQKFVL